MSVCISLGHLVWVSGNPSMTDKIECNIFIKSYIGTIAVVNFAKEFQLNELKYWSLGLLIFFWAEQVSQTYDAILTPPNSSTSFLNLVTISIPEIFCA